VNSGAESSAYRRLWMALAKYCGLEPGLTVQGGNLEGLRSYRFADGPIGLLGILRNLPEAPIVYAQGRAKPLNKESFVFRLKEKKHIYDVREKKYLGYADEIKTEVEAGQAKLFSLLPYTVSEMKLAAPELLKRGEKLEYEVQLETRGGTAGNHVLRIEVIAPNGKEVACLGENIISEKGHYRGGVPIAFNDAPGEWRMRVRDVVSGVKAEQKFRVE